MKTPISRPVWSVIAMHAGAIDHTNLEENR